MSIMAAWFGGCGLFRSQSPPAARVQTPSAPPPAVVLPPKPSRHVRVRAAPVYIRKPTQPGQVPAPQPSPAPIVTLENSDAKGDAQNLLERVALKLAHTNTAELPPNAVSSYQQANELLAAARHAMADQDYVAASSLAEKASALVSQLPASK